MSDNFKSTLRRRDFMKTTAAGLISFSASDFRFLERRRVENMTKIALIKTGNRKHGVKEILKLLDLAPMKDKKIMVKPNFNTADPAPGSTHNDTLSQLILEIKARGASAVTVGERSGPPPTDEVLKDKGIFELADELGFDIINFEELQEEDWVHFHPEGIHWEEGFYIPRQIKEANYIVSTCCLKTHQFGGVFTMSLKLAVGITPKKLMRQLHRSPHMRKMIAEINLAYQPEFILLDGVEAFVDGGPSTGKKVQADVIIAGTDRIAVDAVGLAVLKELGSNDDIMKTRIFDQEQIKRASELKLGVSKPAQIEIVAPDRISRLYARKIKEILNSG